MNLLDVYVCMQATWQRSLLTCPGVQVIVILHARPASAARPLGSMESFRHSIAGGAALGRMRLFADSIRPFHLPKLNETPELGGRLKCISLKFLPYVQYDSSIMPLDM